MRKILSFAAMAAMIVLAWRADGAAAAQKTPAKKTAAKKKSVSSQKSASSAKKGVSTPCARKPGTTTATASSKGKKGPVKRSVTWRNRQMSPTPDRYREIQGALAAKGFLKPEDATGTWDQNSADALKKFQAEQNLESSGKINSLSLIALGLGPKREAPPAKPPSPPPIQ